MTNVSKKSNLEVVEQSEKSNILKEIDLEKNKLRQLLVNEQVIVNRINELKREKAVLQQDIRRNVQLGDHWPRILLGQMYHEKELTDHIPIEGVVIETETDELIRNQREDIQILQKQLNIRNKILNDAGKGDELFMRPDILTYDEVIKRVETFAENRQMPEPSSGRLFFKIKQVNANAINCKTEDQKKSARPRRNHSVMSQNSSLSTGGSSSQKQKLMRLPNPLTNDSSREIIKNPIKIINRPLINAGSRIVVGPTRSLQNTNQLPFIGANVRKETKPFIQKVRPSMFLLEKPQVMHENRPPFH